MWQNVCLLNVNHLLDLVFGLKGHLGKNKCDFDDTYRS